MSVLLVFLATQRPSTIPRSSVTLAEQQAASQPTDRLMQQKSLRVRDALIEEEERPYQVWKEEGSRPLRINLDLLTHRARVLVQRGDRKGAAATYKRCMQLEPQDGRAWLGLSQLRRRQGREEEAARLLQGGLRVDPANPYLLQAWGTLQERRGFQDEALASYSRAVKAQPRHAASWVACGLLLAKRRRLDASAQCLRIACLVAPQSYYVWQVSGRQVARFRACCHVLPCSVSLK